MKYILVTTILFLGIHSIAFSQKERGGKKDKLKHLTTQLELSDTQKDELRKALAELRDDSNSIQPAERKVGMDEALADILTEDQMAKYTEIKANRKSTYLNKSGKRKRAKRMRGKLVHDEETQDKLQEMRVSLESSISAQDREEIASLRQKINVDHPQRKSKRGEFLELSDEEKEQAKERRKASREEKKIYFEKARAFATKYETEIASLFEENKSFFDEKKSAAKEEMKSRREQSKVDRAFENKSEDNSQSNRKQKASKGQGHIRGKRGHRHGRHMSKEVRFLLMDIEKSSDGASNSKEGQNAVSIAPNPANNMTNITYEVKQEGHIKVEIRDDMGRIYDVIADKYLEIGTYTAVVETEKYMYSTYYVSISDGKSIRTEKLIILK